MGDRILKEGLLHASKEWNEPSRLMRDEPKHCILREEQNSLLLKCFMDRAYRHPNGSFKLFSTSDVVPVKVLKHTYDKFVCIYRGRENVTFLRAESKGQRDDWYYAIAASLQRLQGLSPDAGEAPPTRPRVYTAPGRRPVPKPRVRPIQSSPLTLVESFGKVLEEKGGQQPRNLPPPLPSARPTSNPTNTFDLVPRREDSFCCARHHVVSYGKDGTNMAHGDTIYENVHFIESEDKWAEEASARKTAINFTEGLYEDFSSIQTLRSVEPGTDEPMYEDQIGPQTTPGQGNEGVNNLDVNPIYSTADRQTDFRHNVEVGSDEDNRHMDDRAPVTSAVENDYEVPMPGQRGRESQAVIAKIQQEQSQANGISIRIPKTQLVGQIKLMEMKDGIWNIQQLGDFLMVGDQLIKINKQTLPSANFAKDTITSTDDDEVTVTLKRIPHGTVCTIKRQSVWDDIGITLNGNEITNIDPNGLAARRGGLKPQATGVSGRLCNWAITEINAKHVEVFATAHEIMSLIRKSDKVISLIVQPIDFLQMIRDQWR